MDEATRRWLISPQGLLAACAEAAGDGDAAFFDELAASALLDVLDDECLQAPGPAPSDRALALVCAGRLALWCLQGRHRPPGIGEWLAVAVNGLSGPADTGWDPPESDLAVLSDDPRAAAAAVVVAAHGAGAPTAAVLAVGDLIHAFLPPVSQRPDPSPHIRVALLTSRHDQGELVHLGAVSRPGPPGIALDALACPFTRADAAFHQAVTTAWQANRSPSLSARWSVISDRTGVAVEVIGGRSVGAAAGTALRYLTHRALTPLDRSWAVTGALDATGTLVSLLDDNHNLATYRTKLTAAGDRTVVVPTCDHPHLAVLVESGALKARLVPAATLAEITDAAQRHNSVPPGSLPTSPPSRGRPPPPHRRGTSGMGCIYGPIALLVCVATSVLAGVIVRAMGYDKASGALTSGGILIACVIWFVANLVAQFGVAVWFGTWLTNREARATPPAKVDPT